MKNIYEAFAKEVRRQGLVLREWTTDGRAVLLHGDAELIVSLDNLSRNIERDGQETEAIRDFVEGIIATFEPLPGWPEASSGLRFQLENSDVDLGNTLYWEISPMCVQTLVYTDPAEHRVSYLTLDLLSEWGISIEDAVAVAGRNMDALLKETKLGIDEVQEHKLGLLETHSIFKASLVAAPGFRDFVEPTLGWPVFAVIPCRDFAFILPERDQALLGNLGNVVLKEFDNSGYPISIEVFLLSEEGFQAIGSYAPSNNAT